MALSLPVLSTKCRGINMKKIGLACTISRFTRIIVFWEQDYKSASNTHDFITSLKAFGAFP